MSGKKSKRLSEHSGLTVKRKKGQSIDDLIDSFNKKAKKLNRKPKPRRTDGN